MSSFQMRLFFRIISKGREVYFLKIISLAIAFACSTLILLFSINEFGYDRFHKDYPSMFRLLQRNNQESHMGNRLSNKIPFNVCTTLTAITQDSLIISRVKLMDQLNVRADNHVFNDEKFYAADPEITRVFSFEILVGSLMEFQEKDRSVMLSSAAAIKYFGTNRATGKKLKIYTLGDTSIFTVVAIYRDYPQNSHEQFNSFIRFDAASIHSLNFNPEEAGVYGRILQGDRLSGERRLNKLYDPDKWAYFFQPISDIYFGPRVMGEDARHGDHYSIIILICITILILFLALTNFVNLTTLTLPYRSKELAVKKLAGTSQTDLIIAFAKESFLIVGLSLVLGIFLLVSTSKWIKTILSIDLISLLLKADFFLIFILTVLFLGIAIAPLFMTLRFTRATPNRLLSTETITFPRFKKTIMFLQLGISIFLIVASMVVRRQINYSLLKEPGRNYDQVVYLNFPKDMTNESLFNLRRAWKKSNPNIVDVMATSQLPDRITSKEINSPFYFMSVDRGFDAFFEVEMVQGHWFNMNDGDSILVVNEQGRKLLSDNSPNVIGVFRDISGQFNQPGKPVKINIAPAYHYNFLCVRILEVDIRRTVLFLSTYFEQDAKKAGVSFLNKRFEEWLGYQDKLNTLSGVLAIISGLLSCFAIYGLSISIVRDKLKQIAIHKLCGADAFSITRLLVREFTNQMLLAIIVFGPLTYIIVKEILRTFVYSTHFTWLDPFLPLAYCTLIILSLCGLQTLSLNREDLSAALKG